MLPKSAKISIQLTRDSRLNATPSNGPLALVNNYARTGNIKKWAERCTFHLGIPLHKLCMR